MKKLMALIVVICIAFTFAACGETTPQKVDEKPNTDNADKAGDAEDNENKAAAPEIFKIGDTVKAGDSNFTVNGVREVKGNEFIKPKSGNIYYAVDVTVENTGNEALNVSSLLMFKLIDADAISYDVTIGPETKGSLDGEVAPTRKMRGELLFEIPKKAKGLELEIDPSVWGTGKVIVKLDR